MNETNDKQEANNPLMVPLVAALETAINQLFAMDPEIQSRLSRFSGKIIAFHISDFGQNLFFFPDQNGIQILTHYQGEPDTRISGSLIAFARIGLADEKVKTATVFNGAISITGDISLGQHFQALFQQLDIDWEEHLSHYTGDVIAHSVGNFTRGLFDWGKQASQTLGLNLGEYLQYETRDIASGPEIQQFNKDIDQLRNDVERAGARLDRLIKILNPKSDQ